MADKPLYKIIFFNQGKVYELFSEGVTSSGLWGFIEVSDLVFETGEGLVVDPTEEKNAAGIRRCQGFASAHPERFAHRGSQ